MNQAHNGVTFTITGSGRQSRNWIYVDDLVEGCSKVVDCGITNETINLVGKKSYTVNKLVAMTDEVVNGTCHTYKVKHLPDREGDIFKEDISIEKARKLLDWTPKVSLKKALKLCYKTAFK